VVLDSVAACQVSKVVVRRVTPGAMAYGREPGDVAQHAKVFEVVGFERAP